MSTQLSQEQVVQIIYEPVPNAIRVNLVTGVLVTEEYDYIAFTYPSATQEVYTYHLGGVAGPVVAVVTANYTDATKNALLNISKV